MPGAGLEPARSCEQRLLRTRPLPIGLPGRVGQMVRPRADVDAGRFMSQGREQGVRVVGTTLQSMSWDDEDWVGEPPEGHHTRDRANPGFWAAQRPLSFTAAAIGVALIIL